MTKRSDFLTNGVSEELREKLADTLTNLIADAIAIWLKTKNYHWHVTGPNFCEYHLLFDEQSAEISALIDPIAERVRKIDRSTLRSLEDAASRSSVAGDDRTAPSAPEMLTMLRDDNEAFALSLREAHYAAAEVKDIATTSLLETWIDEAEKRIWFLNATLQQHA